MLSTIRLILSGVSAVVWAALRAVPLLVWTHVGAAFVGALVGVVVAECPGSAPGEAELRPSVLSPQRLSYSPLSALRAYKRPDSIRVDTVRVPHNLPQQQPKSDAGTGPSSNAFNRPTAALQSGAEKLVSDPDFSESNFRTPSLGYVIVPLQGGRPALDVERKTAVLSGYRPDSGAGVQYEYDVGGPALEVGPAATVGVGLDGPDLQSLGVGIAAKAGRYRASLFGTRARGEWGGTLRFTIQNLFPLID